MDRTLPHGHVAAVLGSARGCGASVWLGSAPRELGPLLLAMLVARVIEPASKLATPRQLVDATASTSLGRVLGVGLVFVLSAFLSGVAGGMKSLVFQLASLTDAHWHMSGEVVLMTLLGGLGTLFGPAVGAVVIVTLQNELADKVGPWVTAVMGVIFVVCVLAFRRGLVGELLAWRGKRVPKQGH